MKLQEPRVMADASSGLMDSLSVGKGLLPANAVMKAINVVFDRPRGSVSQRYGTTKLGDTVSGGNTILGIHDFRSTTSANNKILVAATTVIYSGTGSGAYTSRVTGLTTGLKTRFITYLDTVAFMNGTDASQSSTNGTTWVTTGGNLDIANFPRAKFAATLNSRVIVGGNPSAPDTLSLSSLESGGAVSWTSGNKSVKVSPQDGAGVLTGIVSNGRLALIFKERGLYRYDDNELQRIGYLGTPSYESIVTDDYGIAYFFGQGANGVGFYRTQGAFPEKISRVVTKIVEAIDSAFYANVCGFTDGNRIQWSIGSVTLDGYTYTNAQLVYVLSDRTWTLFDYADRFRVFSQYITSTGAMTVVGGDTDGDVQTMSSGTTDNGTTIFAECEFSPQVFTTRARTKVVTEVAAYTEVSANIQLMMKVDRGAFIPIGTVSDHSQIFTNFGHLEGHEFTPKIASASDNAPWTFTGIEFPAGSVLDLGNVR